MYYNGLAKKYHFSLSTPIKELGKDALKALLYGTNGEKLDLKRESDRGTSTYQTEFEGIIPNLERRFRETNSSWVKEEIAGIMDSIECPECHGARLKPIILAVTVGGINISEFTNMSVRDAVDFMNNLKLTDRENFIAESIIKEIKSRLEFLKSVGLEYLTLSRSASSLSGGESQRIRLATQIGSSLVGVLYVLDEPSIGLHQRDNEKLIDTLKKLRDLGNTLIVVEHDEDTIRAADYIVDIGPGQAYTAARLLRKAACKTL